MRVYMVKAVSNIDHFCEICMILGHLCQKKFTSTFCDGFVVVFWIGFCLLDQLSGRISGLCESCAIDAHKCADGDMVAARAPQTKNAVRANFSASQLFNWCSCFSDLSACSRWLRIHGLP